MNLDKDPEIQALFQKMKEKDLELPLPDFPEVPKKQRWIWPLSFGVAASVAAAFFFWPQAEQIPEPPAEVIVITLQENENQVQEFVIEEKTYLETWEPPTESLLAEF